MSGRLAAPTLLLAVGCAGLASTRAPAAGPEPGERVFQKCYSCHAVDPAEKGVEGPLLKGVVGRKVASLRGYPYSAAMKAYGADGKTWTRARLDAFIADPPGVVPHTAMNFFGIKDPRERAALIAWLAER
jgi:cytochrome c